MLKHCKTMTKGARLLYIGGSFMVKCKGVKRARADRPT
jgi:hypothetical protein